MKIQHIWNHHPDKLLLKPLTLKAPPSPPDPHQVDESSRQRVHHLDPGKSLADRCGWGWDLECQSHLNFKDARCSFWFEQYFDIWNPRSLIQNELEKKKLLWAMKGWNVNTSSVWGHCNLKSKLHMFVTQFSIKFFGKHNQQGLRVIKQKLGCL